jgi:hypothetical protein
MKNFDLSAGAWTTGAIEMHSNPDVQDGYWFIVGKEGEYISFHKNNGLYVSGTITATGGNIAGWTISSNSLLKGTIDTENSFCIYTSGTTPSKSFGGSGSKTDWRLTIGRNFGIDSSGNLYCNNGHFKGNIYASNWNGT